MYVTFVVVYRQTKYMPSNHRQSRAILEVIRLAKVYFSELSVHINILRQKLIAGKTVTVTANLAVVS